MTQTATDNESHDFERRVMTCLKIAGDGRKKDLQLLPVFKDLMQLVEAHTDKAYEKGHDDGYDLGYKSASTDYVSIIDNAARQARLDELENMLNDRYVHPSGRHFGATRYYVVRSKELQNQKAE